MWLVFGELNINCVAILQLNVRPQKSYMAHNIWKKQLNLILSLCCTIFELNCYSRVWLCESYVFFKLYYISIFFNVGSYTWNRVFHGLLKVDWGTKISVNTQHTATVHWLWTSAESSAPQQLPQIPITTLFTLINLRIANMDFSWWLKSHKLFDYTEKWLKLRHWSHIFFSLTAWHRKAQRNEQKSVSELPTDPIQS